VGRRRKEQEIVPEQKQEVVNEQVQSIEEVILRKSPSKKEAIRFPTGSDLLDLVVGGGEGYGYPGGKIINLVGDKSSGKCIRNAIILTDNGIEKIDDIGSTFGYGESVYRTNVSVDQNKRDVTDKFWKENVTKTIKIRTQNGFSIEGTPDHKIMIYTRNNEFVMKSLSSLKDGDLCVLSRGTERYGSIRSFSDYRKQERSKFANNYKIIKIPEKLNEEIALLLGYYVADGSRTNNFISISSTKDYCRENVKKIIHDNFFIDAVDIYDGVTIKSIEFVEFLNYLLDNPSEYTARYKYVPSCILSSTKEIQTSFLQGLLDNDSYYKDGSHTLNYYTASEKLADQVHLMLFNMGIFSTLKSKYGAKVKDKFYDHTYFSVNISGIDLKKYVQIVGSKKYDFSDVLSIKEHAEKRSEYNSIPYLKSKMQNDISNLRYKLNWSRNGVIYLNGKKRRLPRFLFAGKKNITYSLLNDFITKFDLFNEIIDMDFYKQLYNNNYSYDPIIKIEEQSDCVDVYDVHIPKDHLFWANGFISHNTFLACEIVAASYYKYKKDFDFTWCYDDAESGFTFDTKKLYGIEIIPENEEERRKSRTVEEFFCNYLDFLKNLKKNQFGIYIMDSLDGLSSKEIQERSDKRFKAYKAGKEFDKGSYQMGTPKFLSQEFFKNVTEMTESKHALLIIISQTRDKIDSMFKEQTRSGGKALDFYAHTVLWLSTLTKDKRKGSDRVIGVTIKAHAKKSKTARPYRSCFASLIFDYGMDNIGSNIDFLYDLRDIRGDIKGASEIVWEKGEQEINNQNLKAFLLENNLYDEYQEDKKENKTKMLDWTLSKIEGELANKFNSIFGKTMSKIELVQYIEEKNLQSELTRRVREKWEQLENEIKTNRPMKYQ